MSDKQRAEFERWIKAWGWQTEADDDGYYHETTTQMSWNAWQAAIESVVVELPNGDGDDTGWLVSLTEVEDALDAAGVKYK